MTFLKSDAKGLEVVCAAYLSRDKVMMQEILDGVDIHGENQKYFNLPRLIAKVLLFRIVYGGNEYSFANDPDFASVSSSKEYWKKVIEKFYSKYKGLAQWHEQLIQQATLTGTIITPTGRILSYEPRKDFRGELVWPVTDIKNYPVQSFGADLMSIIRVSFYRRFKNSNIHGVLVNTVHDDIVVDCFNTETEKVASLFYSVFADLPINFKRLFGVEFDLPLRCELSIGNNMKEMVDM